MNEFDVFTAALELTDSADRCRFLEEACGGQPELRLRIDALLRNAGDASRYLETPPHAVQATIDQSIPVERPGTQIGRYKLLEQIGEGGMGIVYVAEQTEPVRRKVALKIIKPGMDTRQVIARFEAERQALAMMDHPNIARILDAGTTGGSTKSEVPSTKQIQNPKSQSLDFATEDAALKNSELELEFVSDFELRASSLTAGRPYFVMELVRGLPITDYCDQARVGVRERLALFITICQAVQHAHQKGIIHRDLKPSNLLVTLHDGQPVVKVIDFGVAKALNQQLNAHTIYTQFSQMIGTPLYMSPEQAEMSGLDVDTRSDVYSLGVLLYELLTGQTPFDSETLKKAGFDEMRRIIREDEPPRPSARLSTLNAPARSTVSQHRGLDDRRLGQLLRGELDWIVMKALDKDRSRRYESASSLAADLQRFLAHEPIQAAPPSPVYRARKFVRRHSVGVSVALLTALLVVAGVGTTAWQAVRATLAERKAEARFEMAKDAVNKYLYEVTRDEQLAQPAFRDLRKRLIEAAQPFFERLSEEHPSDPRQKAQQAEALHSLGHVLGEVGRYNHAHDSFAQAAEIYKDLLQGSGEQSSIKRELAGVLVSRGDLWWQQDEEAKSWEAFGEAFELRHPLHLAVPQDPDLRHELAECCLKGGAGRIGPVAEDMLHTAGVHWQDLVQEHPTVEKYQEHLARVHQASADALGGDEGRAHGKAALQLYSRLAREHPGSVRHALALAVARDNVAQANLNGESAANIAANAANARDWHQLAVIGLAEQARQHPERIDVQVELGRILHLSANDALLVWLQEEQGRAVKANDFALAAIEQRYEAAIEIQRPLVEKFPGTLDYEAHLAGSQLDWGRVLMIQQHTERGTKIMSDAKARLQHIREQAGGHAGARWYLTEMERLVKSTNHETRAGVPNDTLPVPSTALDISALRRDPRRGLLTGIVSYWTGDETADDSIGSNHGTLIGGTTYAAGQVGQAFILDGVDDRIAIADSASLALTGSLTIECWIEVNAFPAPGTEHAFILIRGDDRSGLDPYQLAVDENGNVRFGIDDGTTGASITAPIPRQKFVHVAGTLDIAAGTMTLYVNGVQAAQTATAVRPLGELDHLSRAVGIGSHGGYPFTIHRFLFNGLIDELKVYDCALTAEQVLSNFNAAKENVEPTMTDAPGAQEKPHPP